MWSDDEDLCDLLAGSLINAVGYLPVQRLNRQVDDILSKIHHYGRNVEVILTGSWSEGFRMNGTDVDRMYVDKKTLASEHPEDIPSRFCAVKMEKSSSIPKGYVKLVLVTPNKSGRNLDAAVVQNGGKLYVSSSAYISTFLQDNDETHGPCVKRVAAQGTEQDDAHCLKCSHWPSDAMEWYHRKRPHGWPDRHLINDIYKKGCHLVAIGSKLVDNHGHWTFDPMVWRLSFSVAEKRLVYTFNDTQFIVYGIFKLLVKEAFRDKWEVMCSYFMKTLMFWTIEETPKDFWRKERLVSCIEICFKRLIAWVDNGFCPNYFVRENNMFHGKLDEDARESMFLTLSELYGEGWRGLLRCPSLENLRQALEGARHRILDCPSSAIDPNEEFKTLSMQNKNDSSSFPEDVEDNAFFTQLESVVNAHPNFRSLEKEFFNTVALLLGEESHLDYLMHDTVTLYQNKVLQHIALIVLYKGLNDPRRCARFRYRQIRRALGLLEETCSADISRGRLSLATAYYCMGDYTKALKFIRQYESTIENDQGILYISSRYPNDTEEAYKENFCNGNLTKMEKASMGVSYDFEILRAMPVYPKEIGLEILLVKSTSARVSIPPPPYAIFLKAMCFAQKYDFNKVKILEIELSDCLSFAHKSALHLIYLMLGVCDVKLDQHNEALRYFYHAYRHKKMLTWRHSRCDEWDSVQAPLLYVAMQLRLLM